MPLRPTTRPVSKLCPWSDGRPRPSKAQIAHGLLLLAGCLMTGAGYATQSPSASTEFTNPQRVTMRGHSDDAMEPFLTRDGKYLFFNNSNDPQANTNLHWAERIDELTFQYKGEIGGVNSAALEGVTVNGPRRYLLLRFHPKLQPDRFHDLSREGRQRRHLGHRTRSPASRPQLQVS